jgi:hypothetical protein
MIHRRLDHARIKRGLLAAVVAGDASGLLLLEPAKLVGNGRDVVPAGDEGRER